MNVLLINDDRFLKNEMTEFFRDAGMNLFLAESTRQAIHILSKNTINLVIINLNSILAAGLIKYINNNFKDIKVLLTAENQIEEAISVFKNGSYKLLSNPIKLQELKKIINN